MLDSKGFDLWAEGYDKSVNLSEECNEYPFAGYKAVLNKVYNKVRTVEGASVLDIGFGTGILTTQLYNVGCIITGMDFSLNMIEIAKQKMPEAKLFQWDFSKGLPSVVQAEKFDFIISTYAIHHLTDDAKASLIKALLPMLTQNGSIIFGDVAFETKAAQMQCRSECGDGWDTEEIYLTEEDIKQMLEGECNIHYEQISHCAGVLMINRKQGNPFEP